MAERITTARPSAKAIFALARQNDSLAATADALVIGAQVVSEPPVHSLLGSPHVTPAQLAELVNGIAGSKLDAPGRDFITLLAQNRRLGFLPEIAVLFAQMKAEVENAVDVEVTSATALSPDQESRYAAALQKKLGRSVRLRTKVDQGLLGGAVLRAGDLVIDGSIKGRLDRLATELTA